MKDIFNDKSEEIINLLWSLTENIYLKGNENDLFEEIYKDHNKKFSSHIVNPNENSVESRQYVQNDRYREDVRRREPRDYKYERYDPRYRPRDYDYQRRYNDDRRRKEENLRTIPLGGGKRVILKNRERSRSRSFSEDKLDRNRERNDIDEEKYIEEQTFSRGYYPQDRFYMEQRGFYPIRRFVRGGRFGKFLKPPRFIDPRR